MAVFEVELDADVVLDGTEGGGAEASKDSRLRTAGVMDASRPVLTSEVQYSWNATSECKTGECGSFRAWLAKIA